VHGRHPAFSGCEFVPLSLEGAREFEKIVAAALAEDAAARDLTTSALIDAASVAEAAVIFRDGGVAAGLPISALAMKLVDGRIETDIHAREGSLVQPGEQVATIRGPASGMLSAERVALNFLGRLSGIATVTHEFVDAVTEFQIIIADTRKTTPGLRALERYAVRAGGGCNHRFDLSAAVLIKDNHLADGIGISEAVRRARGRTPAGTIVEVECDSVDQVREAVEAGADAVLLDNMPVQQISEGVKIARGRAVVEASGGITLENIRSIAAAGVEVISVGALTRAAWVDVALDFVDHKSGA
jgi:nicotinate-nucleotide pyrophosphorylase (carboxylating)